MDTIKILFWGIEGSGRHSFFRVLENIYCNDFVVRGLILSFAETRYFDFHFNLRDLRLDYKIQISFITGFESFLSEDEFNDVEGIVFISDIENKKFDSSTVLSSYYALKKFVNNRNIPYTTYVNRKELFEFSKTKIHSEIKKDQKKIYSNVPRAEKGIIQCFSDLFILILGNRLTK